MQAGNGVENLGPMKQAKHRCGALTRRPRGAGWSGYALCNLPFRSPSFLLFGYLDIKRSFHIQISKYKCSSTRLNVEHKGMRVRGINYGVKDVANKV